MRQVEIPVRIRVWKRYRYRVVLIPPRGETRKMLVNELESGNEYYGMLRAYRYGEPISFKVGVKFYIWSWEGGLNTVFVVTDTDCKFCVEMLEDLINQQGTVNGTLTLYLP
jgi:hypothetical protein